MDIADQKIDRKNTNYGYTLGSRKGQAYGRKATPCVFTLNNHKTFRAEEKSARCVLAAFPFFRPTKIYPKECITMELVLSGYFSFGGVFCVVFCFFWFPFSAFCPLCCSALRLVGFSVPVACVLFALSCLALGVSVAFRLLCAFCSSFCSAFVGLVVRCGSPFWSLGLRFFGSAFFRFVVVWFLLLVCCSCCRSSSARRCVVLLGFCCSCSLTGATENRPQAASRLLRKKRK